MLAQAPAKAGHKTQGSMARPWHLLPASKLGVHRALQKDLHKAVFQQQQCKVPISLQIRGRQTPSLSGEPGTPKDPKLKKFLKEDRLHHQDPHVQIRKTMRPKLNTSG